MGMGLALFYVMCGLLLALCATGKASPIATVEALWLQAMLLGAGVGLCFQGVRGIVRKKPEITLDQVDEARRRRLRLHGRALLVLCAFLLVIAIAPRSLGSAVQIGGVGRAVFGLMALSFGLLGFIYQLNPKKLNAEVKLAQGAGIAGTGEILSVKDTRSSLNHDPGVELELSIQLPNRERLHRAFKGYCPRLAVGRLVVGGKLAVRVDEDDDTLFDIDWMHQAD